MAGKQMERDGLKFIKSIKQMIRNEIKDIIRDLNIVSVKQGKIKAVNGNQITVTIDSQDIVYQNHSNNASPLINDTALIEIIGAEDIGRGKLIIIL